jgi:hypothetical protein
VCGGLDKRIWAKVEKVNFLGGCKWPAARQWAIEANAMFAKFPQWSQCKTKKIHCVPCEDIAHIAFVVAVV